MFSLVIKTYYPSRRPRGRQIYHSGHDLSMTVDPHDVVVTGFDTVEGAEKAYDNLVKHDPLPSWRHPGILDADREDLHLAARNPEVFI